MMQKINKTNAWSLKLIDYIADVLEKEINNSKKAEQGTNFTTASSTLDASIKIYSSRVDSVHKAAYKIFGGLSRTEKNKTENGEEPDEQSNQDIEITVDTENPDQNVISKPVEDKK